MPSPQEILEALSDDAASDDSRSSTPGLEAPLADADSQQTTPKRPRVQPVASHASYSSIRDQIQAKAIAKANYEVVDQRLKAVLAAYRVPPNIIFSLFKPPLRQICDTEVSMLDQPYFETLSSSAVGLHVRAEFEVAYQNRKCALECFADEGLVEAYQARLSCLDTVCKQLSLSFSSDLITALHAAIPTLPSEALEENLSPCRALFAVR